MRRPISCPLWHRRANNASRLLQNELFSEPIGIKALNNWYLRSYSEFSTEQEDITLRGSRIVHAVSLAATLALVIGSFFVAAELWKDRVTAFATGGVFLTLYGVAFAMIETWRARSASEMALIAAKSARTQTAAIFDVRSIADCQSCIRSTISDLEKEGWASTSALARIVELYTAQFYVQYRDPESPHRELIASLSSHAASAAGPLKGRSLSRLRQTLVEMLADLTAAAGDKIVEIPQ